MISYRKLAMRVLGHSPVSAVKTARRSTAKRAAALTLTAALVVGMTLPAFADTWYIDNGDISISAGENGNNVTQGSTTKENDTDTVIKSNDSSTAPSHTVTIHADEGKTVNVTLDNVNINTSKTGEAAVSVTGSGNTNIELNGNNTLTSGSGHAGLEHNIETNSEGKKTSGTLTITDNNNDGKLTANGGAGSAGIGGGFGNDGQAAITGGEITASGGYYGAGIGGGRNYNSAGGNGDVAISGGKITARGDDHAAGIGGGGDYSNPTNTGNGNVTISGGEITASGGWLGSGIGGGTFGTGTVTIKGDAIIKDAQGGAGAAGIGGGSYGDGDVKVSGNAIIANAESAGYGSGIGAGQGSLRNNISTVGKVTIEGNAKIENAKSGYGGSGIGGGVIGIGNVIIRRNAQIGNATGGEEGAGIGGGALGTGDVTIEGNVTIENAQGGAGAAGIGGGAETESHTEDTRNKVSIKSTKAGSPDITATGGGASDGSLPGAAAIGSGSVADGANEVKSDITIEGKVTINATGGGDIAIGDSVNGETKFENLAGGTTIKRTDSNGKDVTQLGDVVAEPEPEKPEPEKPEPEKPEPEKPEPEKPEPEKPEPEEPAQPTVTPTETEAAEAPSTGSVEVERPVTVEGLYVTNVLGKQITHTCTQNGTTLTIRANGIVTSAHLTLGMVRTLKAQGVKTLVFTTLLSRSTTVSVDALLAAEPDAPDETAVVWTHTGPRAALTIGGADHSALLK